MEEVDVLVEMCKPLVEHLSKNHNPHTEIVVSMGGIEVKKNVTGIRLEYD